MRTKIVFVSHCILNPSSKVKRDNSLEKTEEEQLRLRFLHEAIDRNIHLIQLPCPEFIMYGSRRWGHTKEQFDHPFFRDCCRELCKPILLQMKGYLEAGEVELLGVIGINGSPSCGVDGTCSGKWGGEFSGRTDLQETLSDVHYAKGEKGVLMEVLSEMLQEEGITLKMIGLDWKNPNMLFELLEE